MEDKGQNADKRKKAWWAPAMAIFFRMSGWVFVPVLIAVFLGKWIDTNYQTEPWGMLGAVGAAFLISMIGIVRQASREYKKIEDNEEDSKV